MCSLTGFQELSVNESWIPFCKQGDTRTGSVDLGHPALCGLGSLRPRLERWPPEGARAPPRVGPPPRAPDPSPGPGAAGRSDPDRPHGIPAQGGQLMLALWRGQPRVLSRIQVNRDHQPENPVGSLCDLHQGLALLELGLCL